MCSYEPFTLHCGYKKLDEKVKIKFFFINSEAKIWMEGKEDRFICRVIAYRFK